MMYEDIVDTCMFFVDDSNIWIEAQKFAASGNNRMPGLADSDRDPRLRIDVGRLISEILDGRSQGTSFLYGSRPPPNDSVWNVFKKCQFETKIFDRSNGKEKEVDTAMSADMSSKATELSVMARFDPEARQKKAETAFIAITGDRDMIPPIKTILDYGIRVELWAWSSGISKDYYRLQAENSELLSVKHLDWIFANISFTNFRSTRLKNIDPTKTVVLCDFADPDEEDVESYVCQKLIALGRLFYTTQSETKTEMFVEFPIVNNIDTVLHDVRKIFRESFAVLSWPEYSSRFQRGLPSTKTSNMYSPLSEDARPGPPTFAVTAPERREQAFVGASDPIATYWEAEEMQGSGSVDSNDGWSTVRRSDPKSRHRRLHRTQDCGDGIRCRKGGSCGYQHTNAEQNLFQCYSGSNINLLKWKTKECNKSHPHASKECPFAHADDEAWCLVCRHEGHYTDSCQYRT